MGCNIKSPLPGAAAAGRGIVEADAPREGSAADAPAAHLAAAQPITVVEAAVAPVGCEIVVRIDSRPALRLREAPALYVRDRRVRARHVEGSLEDVAAKEDAAPEGIFRLARRVHAAHAARVVLALARVSPPARAEADWAWVVGLLNRRLPALHLHPVDANVRCGCHIFACSH